MKGIITCSLLAIILLVSAPSSILAYRFGSDPLNDVIDAAYSRHNLCQSPSGRSLSPKQLIAYMLAPTWWEVAYEVPSISSVNVPSPMTLSRGDPGERYFPPGQSSPRARYHRVFWHTGIGAWQLDDTGMGMDMGPQKFDTFNSANKVAEEISRRYCDRRNVFGPWVACRDTPSRCERTAREIYGRIEDLVERDSSVDRIGGVEPHACRFAGLPATLSCLYVDPLNAQGYTGEVDGNPYGWISYPNAALPLAAPFYVFTLEEDGDRYEIRYWLAEKTGFDRDFAAKRSYRVSARDGLVWIDNPRMLCDVTEGVGSCSEQLGLSQFRSDGTTAIPVGGLTDERTVKLRGFVSDPRRQQVRLEIELRRLSEYNGGFTGERTQESPFELSGRVAEVSVHGLINGRYHWRARTVNTAGETSPWRSFGRNSENAKDFTVQVGTCGASGTFASDAFNVAQCGGVAQITGQSVIDVSATNSVLKANINPNGSAATAYFEYGTSAASLAMTPFQAIGSDFVVREVSQPIAGLVCDTTYQFRAVAINGTGRSESGFQTFRTGACPPFGAPPQVTTQPAIEIGPTSANLKASINPNGAGTRAFFEYGVSTESLTSTGPEEIGSAIAVQPFFQFLTGLICNTSYYYRAVAVNPLGRRDDIFLTFETAQCPQQTCFFLNLQHHPAEGGEMPLAFPSNSVGCTAGRYNPGEQIQVTARPATGWTVRGWTGTLEESDSLTNTVSMSSYDPLVTAYYRPPCERSFEEPRGGEIWKKGEPHTLKWSWGGCSQTVRIELFKEGEFYADISTTAANARTYTWTPALWHVNASNYQIKIVDASDPSLLILTHHFTLTDP